MRAAILAVTALVCAAGVARADVTYQLTNQIYSDDTLLRFSSVGLGFTVTDEVVARGGISFTSVGLDKTGDTGITNYYDKKPVFIGSADGLVSFYTSAFGGLVTPDYLYGGVSLLIAFNPDRTISSFRETFFGIDGGSRLSGSGSSVSGTFGGHNCGENACTLLSAQLTQVPEPVSMTILASGLLAGLVLRRRV